MAKTAFTTDSPFFADSSGILCWPGGQGRCALGKGGVATPEAKQEGDGATPLGVWPMRQVFWREDRLARPATGLPIDALIPEAGWCDDPADPQYNRHVKRPYPASAEALWREDGVYDLIIPLGAPWGAWDDACIGNWLTPELDWVREAVTSGTTTLRAYLIELDTLQKTMHKMRARLFAIADDIDARPFLHFERHAHRIALAFRELLAFQLPRRPQHLRLGQPRRLGQAAGYGGPYHGNGFAHERPS